MQFAPGYFPPGYFAPGLFGGAPLDADEMVLRHLKGIVVGALAKVGQSSIPVWTDFVPTADEDDASAGYPCVLIVLHNSKDDKGGSAQRLMTWAEYKVLVIGVGDSFVPTSPIKGIIDTSIEQTKAGLTSDGRFYVSKAFRRTTLRYPDPSTVTGTRYNYSGGIYRLMYFAMPGTA